MNNIDFNLLAILVLMIVAIVIFTFVIMELYVSVKKYENHKKRVGQLDFKESRDVSVEEAVDKITKFVDTYILKSKDNPKDKETEIGLKMMGWDQYFGPKEFRAFTVFMLFVGVISGFLFSLINTIFGLIVGAIVSLAVPLFFKSESKNMRTKYLQTFPDLIIILNGYLEAGFTLSKAVEETITFASTEWKPILKKMVTDIELMSVDYALSELRVATDIPEVQEFASLIKVAFEQGTVGSSFSDQANRMMSIQEDLMLAKIAKRRSLAIVAQSPTMLALFIIVGVPVVNQMMGMLSEGIL